MYQNPCPSLISWLWSFFNENKTAFVTITKYTNNFVHGPWKYQQNFISCSERKKNFEGAKAVFKMNVQTEPSSLLNCWTICTQTTFNSSFLMVKMFCKLEMRNKVGQQKDSFALWYVLEPQPATTVSTIINQSMIKHTWRGKTCIQFHYSSSLVSRFNDHHKNILDGAGQTVTKVERLILLQIMNIHDSFTP